MPIRRTYRAGEPVGFFTSSNYPAFIQRSEIRIYERNKEKTDAPLAIIPVTINHQAVWRMPAGAVSDFRYVLRVYDSQGRYDETAPLTLARSARDLPGNAGGLAIAPGMGDDRTALRNIPIRGGAVTLFGQNIPAGFAVNGFGETIPLDPARKFVVQRILPPGDHSIDVTLNNTTGHDQLHFDRDINIPDNDWFYVALADVSTGKRSGDARIEEVRPGEYDTDYTKGRLAFYLKGKIKGEYLLTAAADTTDDDLKNIFRNLNKRDAKRLLRRLNPNDYYPVYGDDSILAKMPPPWANSMSGWSVTTAMCYGEPTTQPSPAQNSCVRSAKYGMRYGSVRYRSTYNHGKGFEDNWQNSTAHLGIIRADLRLLQQWDLMLEGRIMHMPQARTTDYGQLIALYRHVGKNFKVGVGYNFGEFSDDLRDLTYNDRGMFVNFIGKF